MVYSDCVTAHQSLLFARQRNKEMSSEGITAPQSLLFASQRNKEMSCEGVVVCYIITSGAQRYSLKVSQLIKALSFLAKYFSEDFEVNPVLDGGSAVYATTSKRLYTVSYTNAELPTIMAAAFRLRVFQ